MKRKVSTDENDPLRESKRLGICLPAVEQQIITLPTSSPASVATNNMTIPRLSSVHTISCSSSEGACSDDEIDDQQSLSEDDVMEGRSVICQHTASESSPLLIAKCVSCTDLEELPVESDDNATAVVFEAGLDHFDRSNRCQRERPLRVTSVLEHLQSSSENFPERCRYYNEPLPGESTAEQDFLDNDDYLRVHLPGYMQRLDRLSQCKCHDRLDDEAQQFQSIFFTPDSVKAAKAAASSLCRLVGNVVKGNADNGFAVIRPPGHHAEPGLAGGFCVINNVAVAAAYARAKLGIKRVLVVDWDVHHGNGTQSIFLKDPNVLYFSVHRWEGGRFFPHSSAGGPNVVGSGEGAGYNVNVGWSRKGMGDEEYLAVWESLLMPIAREFQPELVLVSAGFDAAKGDMGECNVTPECFGNLTRRLMTLANGKVVCALEGGYVRSILGKSVACVIRTLLSRKSTLQDEESHTNGTDILNRIHKIAAKNIRDTIAAHKPYWKCLGSSDDNSRS